MKTLHIEDTGHPKELRSTGNPTPIGLRNTWQILSSGGLHSIKKG